MLTESQKRALRAKTLLDSGMDAREAARIAGYKGVNGMMGAIALCSKSVQKKEAVFDGSLRSPDPSVKLYPVEDGMIWVRKEDITVSYRPQSDVGPTVHIDDKASYRRNGHPRWLALVGKDIGGKPGIIRMLRQISEACAECAALIEDEIKGGR